MSSSLLGIFSSLNYTYNIPPTNAIELATKPACRPIWKYSQRYLMSSTGYYEWKNTGSTKQPYFIRSWHNEPLVYTPELWDRWGKGQEALLSCSIVTTEATGR
ncbi:SOS response-associated peptidase family protein [Desulfogranum marinum]|uniref:SOS response-associated peptidase family protein n=1 Tax=Desulfogranum marinum TaxID=453220 RepID=UPI001964B892|nr:SOS response-associated peptidase family protein [Desulfogranum marinum]